MNEQNKSNNNQVSALDTALKLLLDVYRKIKYFLGVIIVDKFMRSCLNWYDKRHPNSSNLHKQQNESIRTIQLQLDQKKQETEALHQQIAEENKRSKNMHLQLEEIKADFSGLQFNYENLLEENKALKNSIKNLNSQNAYLSQRCLPETEIPSMIYYAQGDATGMNLRKVTTTKNIEQIYILHTRPGNTQSAEFYPIIRDYLNEIVQNRHLTLLACEIMGIAPNPTKIEVLSPGQALFQNNRWVVTNKAKIKIL